MAGTCKKHRFGYLVAVDAGDAFRHIDPLRDPMDWVGRRVLSWRLSMIEVAA
jgi:hypothetical protein